MSRFLSHREMKAVSRVLGGVTKHVADIEDRLTLMEGVLSTLLTMAGMELSITEDGAGIPSVRLVPIPPPEPVVEPLIELASPSVIELT